MVKVKTPTVSLLKKKCDIVFSHIVRIEGSNKDGMCSCFTCGVIKYWKEIQAGHYISRTFISLRFDKRNVKPQCVGCNVFKKGNLDEYAVRLQRRYGVEILEELNKIKRKEKRWVKKLRISELQELLDSLMEELKALKLVKGIS